MVDAQKALICSASWHTPVNTNAQEAETGESQIPGQPGLHSKFKTSLNYIKKLHFKNKTQICIGCPQQARPFVKILDWRFPQLDHMNKTAHKAFWEHLLLTDQEIKEGFLEEAAADLRHI
jgi:hypothetical protein